MSDVLLAQTNDGGDITLTASGIVLEEGLETAVYLSLFGGNAEDDGSGATAALQFWGNRLEEGGSSRAYRSQTLAVVEGLPLTSSNLARLKLAAENDTSWLVADGVASARAVTVAAQGPTRVEITVSVTVSTETYAFTFSRNWGES